MKRNFKVMVVVLLVANILISGVSAFRTTVTYKKYMVALMAKAKGATMIEIKEDRVAYYRYDGWHVTVLEAGYTYHMNKLSGK